MRILKRVAIAIAVLIVLLVVGAVAMVIYIDSLAKEAIERGATYALGVSTNVGGADVGIFEAELTLDDVNVNNPDGFETDHFLTIDEGGTAVSLGTLRQETIELPHLTLSGVDMNLERKADGSNYRVILDNLKRFESKAPPDPNAKKYIIRQVNIADVNVHVRMLPLGGGLAEVNVPVEQITLQDVGSETDRGVLMAELTNIIIKAVLAAAIEKGGGLIPDDVLGELSGQLAQLQSLGDMGIEVFAEVSQQFEKIAGEGLEGVGKELEGAGKRLEEEAEGALRGLGGLLGGEKRDENTDE